MNNQTKRDNVLPVVPPACWKRDSRTPGWFCVYLETRTGEQISYHVPEKYMPLMSGIPENPYKEFDGHTPEDVVARLIDSAKSYRR
jgi:hypothetical protein